MWRGVRAGIDLAMILRVARTIDPETLTMQAVDREAVDHHLSDRGALLHLVAMDAFTANFSTVRMPAGADWRAGSSQRDGVADPQRPARC